MSVSEDIAWFKKNFAAEALPRLTGTPLSFDLICAIAVQETGELWRNLRRSHSREEVLRLAVGDTISAPRRRAFPKNKAALIAEPRGEEMFKLANQLLKDMADATGIKAYKKAAALPDKFVHGYGIFQNDLQHFKDDPDYFLEQRWTDPGAIFDKLMGELRHALASLKFTGKTTLTDQESSFVAIVYNTGFGNFKAAEGLKQGFFDGAQFYGEHIDSFLKIARAVPTPSIGTTDVAHPSAPVSVPATPAPTPGAAPSRSVVTAAKAEFDRFQGVDEGTQPLRDRIADYYEAGGGSRSLDPTRNENAWSAAFISFCVKQGGATAAQFKFNLSHSVFVHAAIANAHANSGVFRGHRVGEHAVRLGDIVHHNRDGGTLGFEFARDHTGYPSHSCIVVGFEMRDGVRHAITVGGNEGLAGGSGTVGTKAFALNANGFLDQSRIGPRLICVIENLLEQAAAPAPAMTPGRYVVRVRQRSSLFIRGGPGSSFAKLDAFPNGLPRGTELTVIAFQGTPHGPWALVDLQGDGDRDGFVSAAFIDPLPA